MVIPMKKTRGRQKVPMVRMEKESNRLVTFSKRRSGLFKKASELCTLTGADVVVVVFSPGRKAFSFGHPSVDTVINRFLGVDLGFPSHARTDGAQSSENDQPGDILAVVNREITLLNNRLEVEKKHNEELTKLRDSDTKGSLVSWGLPILDKLEVPQLKQLLGPIVELRNKLVEFRQKHTAHEAKGANPLVPFPMVQHPMGPNYHFPPNMVEGQMSFGGQSSMLHKYPNEHPPPMSMIPTPMPNPLGMGGYFDMNVPHPFDFGGHHEGSSEPPPNVGMDTKSFTSFLIESNPMDAPSSPPSNIQDRLGFKLGL